MIYKYFAPSSFTLENLAKRQLVARHYSDFNDPFEFWARIRSGLPDPEKDRERYLEALRTWGGDEELERDLPEYFQSLAEAQPDFNLLYDFTRITCFASSATNLLMWAHYADGLRGVCVGFDEELLLREADAYLATVRYSERPPVVDSFIYAVAEDQRDYHRMALAEHRGPHPDPFASDYEQAEAEAHALMVSVWENAFASKPAEWSYEQEKRLLMRTGEGGTAPIFVSYSPNALTEIIVGERMPSAFRVDLEKALQVADVRIAVRTARRSRESYSVKLT
jgi:hypothetical protein